VWAANEDTYGDLAYGKSGVKNPAAPFQIIAEGTVTFGTVIRFALGAGEESENLRVAANSAASSGQFCRLSEGDCDQAGRRGHEAGAR
jgi:hypothetical protein